MCVGLQLQGFVPAELVRSGVGMIHLLEVRAALSSLSEMTTQWSL